MSVTSSPAPPVRRWSAAKINAHQGSAPAITGDPVVDALLKLRGIGPDIAEPFLNPNLGNLTDPLSLPQMEPAAKRVLAAIAAGESIALYGDYDVDGVTSLSILKFGIEALGGRVHCFLPHRMDEGYGLSDDGIERLLNECQPDLVLAVDCGTTSKAEGEILAAQGIDLIVIDHHQGAEETFPPAIAIVNPQLGPDQHYLCSAGLAFKFLHALQKIDPSHRKAFDLRSVLDLAAVGTVADLVPLEDDNRLLVTAGLKRLANTQHPGLRALIQVAAVGERPIASDIGFRIGPRLNAAGRLDSALDALHLLTAGDDAEALAIASALDAQNRERQTIEAEVLKSALAQIEALHGSDLPAALVLAEPEWHPGVVGIVASRIMRRFHRPTFIIGFDESGMGKGSGRSIQGINLVEHIDKARHLLVKGGGHAAAAGISVQRDQIDSFRAALTASIAATTPAEVFIPEISPDIETSVDQLNLDLLNRLDQVAPFGMGNPEPLMIVRHAGCVGEPRKLKDKHWKFRITDESGGTPIDAIWFSGCETHPELPAGPWDIAFMLQRNVWRGRESVQLLIRDLRTSE
ncbi:single-stranded-DNA-specific exonuclease RecJ [Sulfuriroseicoccus oceanibius]|uniref:Single-stranded-DNA-specific exonuclease RecJ n=1 Tax=Sulfuriroseicoccus oceanibius TaxID=2707525 RepID=A0A6B3L6N8_9BACT|nr:single-stranded-DNA-specific exonuclease RecJ [Sulfuriroseicoccus oceanibius]QQL44957.1 single-stranded-DNA-specific exonuclease RecJ [Sulfuriroseicoccus oceanibius]